MWARPLSAAALAGVLLLPFLPPAAAVVEGGVALPIEQCRLTTQGERQVSLGFNRPANRVASVGQLRATVVLVDFSDAPVTPKSRAQSSATIASLTRFLSAASYGRLSLVATAPDVWLRMPRTAAAYSAADDGSYSAHYAYLSDAIAVADAAVDFSTTDVVVVLAATNVGGLAGGSAFVPFSGDGITVDGHAIENMVSVGTILDGSDIRVLAHELLHTVGLPDLYAVDAAADDPYPFTGPFDLMADVSAASPSPTAWEKWVLGWIDDSQVRCIGGGTSSSVLAPIESAGGLKALIVPRDGDRAVVVERRAGAGIDAAGPFGVIVYLVDPQRDPGHGPLRLARTHGQVMFPLVAGQAITLDGVRVSVGRTGRVTVRAPSAA